MKTNHPSRTRRPRAFTLIELLVVMAIIATLAAILFPAFAAIKKGATIKKARAEMVKVVMAVDSYKAQFGHYPPDNPDNGAVNQLFYELAGTTNLSTGIFLTTSGLGITNPTTFYGPKVVGFVNLSRGGGDDVQSAKNFMVGLKPNQYLEVVNGGVGTVLGVLEKGPLMLNDSTGNKSINPWRYVSTGPTNNPGHFDLWVDILLGGKTNRISNWSEKPELVAY
jgi:prepilin-type N-terminal cleavage/methylation domain-containing protein